MLRLLPALVPADDRLDLHLAERVRLEDRILAVACEQQWLEGDLRALVLRHAVDEEAVPLFDAVLLAACLDDGVHERGEDSGPPAPCRAATRSPSRPSRGPGRGRRGARAGAPSACRRRRPLPPTPPRRP